MRNSRKVLLVGVAALAAVAVLALPASASAGVWKHKGEALKTKVELSLSGSEVIETSGAVMICNVTATMTTEGGSTAKITAYNVDKASCVGLEGKLVGCEVTAVAAKGLSWSVTVNTSDLTAKEVKVDYTFNKGCGIGKIETNFSKLTLTPDEPKAIRLFHFSQAGTAKVDGKEASLTASGTLNLPEKDFDTYGVGWLKLLRARATARARCTSGSDRLAWRLGQRSFRLPAQRRPLADERGAVRAGGRGSARRPLGRDDPR
jgi:hypothetical protein